MDIIQCKIAFKNNEGVLETFGSDCFVTGQRKLLTKVFEDCEKKKRKQPLLARDHWSAHAQNYLSAQCKRKLSH